MATKALDAALSDAGMKGSILIWSSMAPALQIPPFPVVLAGWRPMLATPAGAVGGGMFLVCLRPQRRRHDGAEGRAKTVGVIG